MHPPQLTMSRAAFLRGSIKLFALTSLTMSGVDCGPSSIPSLKGINEQEYRNMNAVGEVFLADSPFPDFDLGQALDDYVFGHPSPLDTKDIVRELAGAPSSYLAAIVLDGSLTPLVKLSRAEREARMLGWKKSDNIMKRGLYNILRQTTFFLLSSSPALPRYAGYAIQGDLVPYGGGM